MIVTLNDVRQKFEALNGEAETREEIAAFAARAMAADDAGELKMEPEFAEKIWKSILYLSGVDLQEQPNKYLHTKDDFSRARDKLGI